MVFIPRRNQSNELTRGSKGPVNVGTAGTQSLTNAIEKAGATIEGIGTDILQEEKDSRDRIWAFNQTVEDRKALDEQSRTNLQQNGFEKHGEEVQKFSTELAKSSEKSAPSPEARRMYQSSMRPALLNGITNAAKVERVQRIDSQRKFVLDYSDRVSEEIAVHGNPVEARDQIEQAVGLARENVGKLFTKQEFQVMEKKIRMDGALRLAGAMAEKNPERLLALAEASVTGKKGVADIQPGQKILEVDPGIAIRLMGYAAEDAEGLKNESGKIPLDLDETMIKKVRRFGDDKVGQVFRKGLSSAQLESVLRTARSKAKQKANKELSQLGNLMKEGDASASEGDLATTTKQAELINRVVQNSSSIPDSNKARLAVQTEGMKGYAQAVSELNSVGLNETGAFLAETNAAIEQIVADASAQHGNTSPAFARDLTQKLKKQATDRTAMHRKKLQSDPMSVVVEKRAQDLVDADSPQARQVIRKDLMDQQAAMSAPNPRATTLKEARSLAADIGPALQNAQTAAQVFQQIEDEYGPDLFPIVAKELSQQKGMPEDLALLAYAPDQGSKSEIISNLVNRTAIKVLFTKKGNSVRDVESGVVDAFPDLERALSSRGHSGSNDATINGIFNQLETTTMRLMNDGMSESEARDQAYQKIVSPNFHVTDVDRLGLGGEDSNLLIPRTHSEGRPTRVDTIEAFMRSHHQGKGLSSLGIEDELSSRGIEADESTINRMAREGEWVNDGMDGLVFVVPGEAYGSSEPIAIDATRKSFQELSEGPFDTLTLQQMGKAPPKQARPTGRMR